MRRRVVLFLICVCAALGLVPIASGLGESYDSVIRNGRIVDGSGNPWFRADVAIKDGRIAKIGRVGSDEARETLDVEGMIMAPGFIDVHTHVEGNIERQPSADNFVHMGVTTVITGNCGSSALPVGEFLTAVGKGGIAINLATLVGHNAVRRAVMSLDDRAPTPEELDRMRGLVDQAMRDGAVGLSTGLIYEPGSYAKTEEVIELTKVAARFHGVYASHIRGEGNEVEEAIREALAVGKEAGCPVEISHFKISSKKKWGQSTRTVKLVSDARNAGQQVTIDQYAYTASSTSLGTLLPDWVFAGGQEKLLARLKDPASRARIKEEMIKTLRGSGFKDYSHAYVASYGPAPSLAGLNISEITVRVRKKKGLKEECEQVMDMVTAGGAGMVYHKMSEKDVEYIMRQPFTMIASDSGVQRHGQGVPHPRGYGDNARVLGQYVRERGVVTLEDAIRKMTSLPAQTFGLRDRGLIREGLWADLVVFDDKRVIDKATFKEPHQYPEGIAYVLVNGQVALRAGEQTPARAGRILYGPGLTGTPTQ